ncbi:hypothetical protein Lal_00001848 [Lupinus albus]|nr:hypothetical protein Lal_00001848 [Lupinus albus]
MAPNPFVSFRSPPNFNSRIDSKEMPILLSLTRKIYRELRPSIVAKNAPMALEVSRGNTLQILIKKGEEVHIKGFRVKW